MKSNAKKYLTLALCLLAVFALWTVAVCLVNVQPIGPENSAVGVAGINGAVDLDLWIKSDSVR